MISTAIRQLRCCGRFSTRSSLIAESDSANAVDMILVYLSYLMVLMVAKKDTPPISSRPMNAQGLQMACSLASVKPSQSAFDSLLIPIR